MEIYPKLSLPKLHSFGEYLIPGENRDVEQLHALHILPASLLPKIMENNKHWTHNSFTEEEDMFNISTCAKIEAEQLLTDRNYNLILLLGERGTGKTFFLYHLFDLAKKLPKVCSNNSPCSKPNYSYYNTPNYSQSVRNSDNNEQSNTQIEDEMLDNEPMIPIYVSAVSIYKEMKRNPKNSLLHSIAEAASLHIHFDPTSELMKSTHNPLDDIKENLLNILHVQKVILLIDNLDLLPMNSIADFLQLFIKKENSTNNNNNNSQNDRIPHGKIIISATPLAIRSFYSNKDLLKQIFQKDSTNYIYQRKDTSTPLFQCIHISPGFTFNILVISQIRSLLQRWPMIESSQCIDSSATRWAAFEAALRAHRKKLYTDSVVSPILLFILARRLAKGSISDGIDGSDKEFSLDDLLEDLFDDCIRKQFTKCIQTPMNDSEDGENNNNNMRLDGPSYSCELLKYYDLNIAQVKTLCSFIGFLCHWLNPSSLNALDNDTIKKKMDDIYYYIEGSSHTSFIEMQLQHILSQPSLATLLGFNVPESDESSNEKQRDDQNSMDIDTSNSNGDSSLDSCEKKSFLKLTNFEVKQLVQEIFIIMNNFYQLTEDGNARCCHYVIQEFLAAKFLTGPSYFTMIIQRSMLNTFTSTSGKTISLIVFDWSKYHFQTNWWWDGVLQFSGVRKGVVWMGNKLLGTSSSPPQMKKNSSPHLNEHHVDGDLQNFENWMKVLRQGYDPDDLGQIRIQILVRIYSTICIHRSSHHTLADPLTESIGAVFIRLLQQTPTVLVHLEVFPNHFLSAFTPQIAQFIINKCILIFLNRSTAHAVNIISKFHFSSYLDLIIKDLVEQGVKKDAPTRLAIFNVIKKVVNESSLEKTNLEMIIRMLSDSDGLVRREVVTSLVEIGVKATQQVSTYLLSNLFENGDTLPVISAAIKVLTEVVEANELSNKPQLSFNKIAENDNKSNIQRVLEAKLYSTVVALLSDPDPGASLLGYLTYGSPNFTHDNSEETGLPAQAASFYICSKISLLLNSNSTTSILEKGSNTVNVHDSNIREPDFNTLKNRGGVHYTVSLSNLITITLGETAACWASSVFELLKYKRDLITHVNSTNFQLLSDQQRKNIIFDLLNSNLEERRVIESETLKLLLLVRPVFLLKDSTQTIVEYVQSTMQNISTPLFIRILAMKLYVHLSQHLSNSISIIHIKEIIDSSDEAVILYHAADVISSIGMYMNSSHITKEEIQALYELIANPKYHNHSLYFILTASLKFFSHLPIENLSVDHIPIVQFLSNSIGSIRQSSVEIIDTIPSLFISKVRDIIKLFNERAPLIRAAATSSLACLARRGFHLTVCEEISIILPFVNEIHYHTSPPYPVSSSPSFIESILRVLSQIGNDIPDSLKFASLKFLNHSNNRIKLSCLDCIKNFPPFLVSNENKDYFHLILGLLSHSDSEIRSASENTLKLISPHIPSNYSTQELSDLFNRCFHGAEYYEREAAINIAQTFGPKFLIANCSSIVKLLTDTKSYVRIVALRALREILMNSNDEGILPLFLSTVIYLTSDKTTDVRKEALRLLRATEYIAKNAAECAGSTLSHFYEPPEVKKQALLLLGSIDSIPDQYVTYIIETIKGCKDARLLADVSNAINSIGYPAAKLVPKIITSMKSNENFALKRKLLKLIKPFEDKLFVDYLHSYNAVLYMSTDGDNVVRRKAAELMSKMAAILPSQYTESTTSVILKEIVRTLVGMSTDKNSFVRKEVALALGEVGAHQPLLRADILDAMLANDDEPYQNILVWRLLSWRWGTLIATRKRTGRSSSRK